jgi:glycosyltransferase involved in cell wall biosynthesis
MWPLTVIAIIAAKVAGYKGRIIVSDHVALSKSPQARNWIRRIGLSVTTGLAYRLADVRLAVSTGVADDLARLSRIPRRQFEVVYNPAALGDQALVPAQAPPPIPGCEKLILSVGNLKLQKDQATLIKSFALIPRKRGVHLLILGEGDQRRSMERLIDNLGLQGRVHLPGFVTDTRPYFEAADLFVLSSKWEGFGNVIVEALDCGVPVVSTDCPHGPGEILEGGKYGHLVAVGDVEALAQAIEEALLGQHDKESLKRRAADFGLSLIAAQYLRLMFPGHETKYDEN